MTEDDIRRLCRRIKYDKAFAKEYGRVPIRPLCAVAGLSDYVFKSICFDGALVRKATGCRVDYGAKLRPFLEKIIARKGRFVYVWQKGFSWHDDILEGMKGDNPHLRLPEHSLPT